MELIRDVPFQYEPKVQNRFYADFPSELGIEKWKIQEFKRPSIKFNKIEIPFINEANYTTNNYRWDEMTFKLIDPIGPSTTQQVMEWVRLEAESLTGRMGYNAGHKKTIILYQLDPIGAEIDKWTLEQCLITAVDFGDNSMSGNELSNITVTVQPWRCINNN